jgi:hypothetical protein
MVLPCKTLVLVNRILSLVTVTVIVLITDPPVPVQVRVKVVFSLIPLMVSLPPFLFLFPVQPPEAVQESTFLGNQVKVTSLPFKTEVGDDEKVRDGTATISTNTDLDVFTPSLVQVIVKFVSSCRLFTTSVPPAGDLDKDQVVEGVLEAVQVSALSPFQVRVTLPPSAIGFGLAVRVTLSGAKTVTVVEEVAEEAEAVKAPLVQVMVKVLSSVIFMIT